MHKSFLFFQRLFKLNITGIIPEEKFRPRSRVSLILILDLIYLSFSIFLAFLFTANFQLFDFGRPGILLGSSATIFLSGLIFILSGLYRATIRFMGQHAIWSVLKSVTFSSLVLVLVAYSFKLEINILTPLVYWVFAVLSVGGTRLCIRAFFHSRKWIKSNNVIIYGAGDSGRQLLTALQHGEKFRVIAFADDNSKLHGSVINGVPVVPANSISSLVKEFNISQVLLALPRTSSERRREIINSLAGLSISVKTIPKISELVTGRAFVGQIQDVDLMDLLGREPVPPNPELIDTCIASKVVMVTGAGGSIGAELCRQILGSFPSVLVMLDNSEYALYQVEKELQKLRGSGSIELVALLGSAQDLNRMETIYKTFSVQTVYHAAAYKHVPIVEYNVAEGVSNNIFGAMAAAQAAHMTKVETFVLVSTDKAVRPANIMGASKRFAELVVQGLASEESHTRFCIVRFGNVLGSSGSVVPLFRDQIHNGGPVTVTHPDVSRYFMSLQEAAQLVLQAGAMATGGDVFVLDMGEPIRILELARRMIQLSGYDISSVDSEAENIEIEFIGLRPGEKLHEELLLGSRVAGTGHPMIMRAEEETLPFQEIKDALRQLKYHCSKTDCAAISAVLQQTVQGYSSHEIRHDHVWVKQGRVGKRLADKPFDDDKIKDLFPNQFRRE